MPPPPEIFYGYRKIGALEIICKRDTEQPGYTLRKTGAGHKIGVELKTVQYSSDQDIHSPVGPIIVKDCIYDDSGFIGDAEFQEKAPQNVHKSSDKLIFIKSMAFRKLKR